MAVVNLYRQQRNDGGIRTGAEVDGEVVLGLFEPGADESDAALVWYIDVEWQGEQLPTRPNDVRDFLVGQSAPVRSACGRLGDRLAAGVDIESPPFTEQFDTALPGIRGAVFCSAIRRLAGRDIKRQLDHLAMNWGEIIGNLAEVGVGSR